MVDIMHSSRQDRSEQLSVREGVLQHAHWVHNNNNDDNNNNNNNID